MTAVPVTPTRSRALPASGLAAAAAIFGLILLLAMTAQPEPATQPQGSSGGLNTAGIPAAYVPWVLRAGSLCAAISPPVIAAQDQAESNWNLDAVSGAHAEGIAQFLPSTFSAWGRDDDGTGNVSPYNPRDEIMAQGRYDCYLAGLARHRVSSGQETGTVTGLALASYDAGPDAVGQAHGIPADAAAYVHQIDHLAATKYSITTTAGSQAGLTAVAAAETALGTPYYYGGSCSDPHGQDPARRCDCSSLTQMAWRAAGVSLPRTTYQQVHSGSPVASAAGLRPGDLIFLPGSDGTRAHPGHVGIYVGGGRLIEAPHTGTVVQFATVSSWQSQIVAMRHIG